jgi:predicted component of type VI protein secretion system
MLGRAPDADVQILDEGVSRQHARIKIEDDGRVSLIDLRSASGTRVGGRRVEKKVFLRAGETIQIGDARFVYEQRHGHLVTSPSFVEKTNSVEAMHRTNAGVRNGPAGAKPSSSEAPASSPPNLPEALISDPHGLMGSPQRARSRQPAETKPTSPPAPSTPAHVPPERSEPRRPVFREISSVAPRSPLAWEEEPGSGDGPSLPVLEDDDGINELAALFTGADVPPEPQREPSGRFSLPGPDEADEPEEGPATGGPQLAALVERLLRYHELAAQATQDGRELDPNAHALLATLDEEFRKDPGLTHSRRQWRRFNVQTAADAVWFRNLASKSLTVRLQDLSAAGVRFSTREMVFSPGDLVSVIIAMPDPQKRQAVFSARIAWVSNKGDVCGAMFVGPGSWQPRD